LIIEKVQWRSGRTEFCSNESLSAVAADYEATSFEVVRSPAYGLNRAGLRRTCWKKRL